MSLTFLMMPWLRVLKALLRFCARDRARATIVGCRRVCGIVNRKARFSAVPHMHSAYFQAAAGARYTGARLHHLPRVPNRGCQGKFSANAACAQSTATGSPYPGSGSPLSGADHPLVFYRCLGTILSWYNRGTNWARAMALTTPTTNISIWRPRTSLTSVYPDCGLLKYCLRH